jgi:Kef-type K+ transport system membrane component KefB
MSLLLLHFWGIYYIHAGLLLGPALADVIAHADAFVLLGTLGVHLFVIEGGLELDFDQVNQVKTRAFCAAFVGVAFPMLFAGMY